MQQLYSKNLLTANKKTTKKLILGITFLPIIFSWVTLQKGYSNETRICSFLTLIMWTTINIKFLKKLYLMAFVEAKGMLIELLDKLT